MCASWLARGLTFPTPRDGDRGDHAPLHVADMAAALDDDGFEYYLPDMKGIAVFKANDIDTYMRGSIDALGT